jgi:HlyD family secretion protein
VRASIITAVHEDVVVVPIQAVVQRPPVDDEEGDEIPVVFVLDESAAGGDGATAKAVQRPVTTGISDATHVEITDGLAAGETVVVGPYRTLRDLEDGDTVRRSKDDDEKNEDAGSDDEDASDSDAEDASAAA